MSSEWDATTLENVCSTITDGSHTSPASVETGKYMASVKDMDLYSFDFSKCRRISDYDYNILVRNGCKPHIGDVLIGKDGARYLEDIFIYKQEEDVVLLSSIAILRPDYEKIQSEYLYYFLSDKNTISDIKSNYGSGSAIPRMVLKAFKKVPIAVPSLSEQKAITSVLACLDDKIELNNRMNKNLEEMAQAIFKSWFVDFEPFHDGEFVDSELGRIPEGWRVGTLGDICSYTRERISVDSLSLSTYISTENMLPNKAGYINASGLPSVSQTTKFSAGDILISNIRPYFKKIVFCSHDGGCSADVLCIKSTRFQFASFTYFVVFSDRFFDFMMLGSKGTKMPRGDKSQIMKYKIIIPSDNAQETFCKIVDPIIQFINQNKFENNNLSSLRDTLLPKLMSGEIRVPIQEE